MEYHLEYHFELLVAPNGHQFRCRQRRLEYHLEHLWVAKTQIRRENRAHAARLEYR